MPNKISSPGQGIVCISNLEMPSWYHWLFPMVNVEPWINLNGYFCSEIMPREPFSYIRESPLPSAECVYPSVCAAHRISNMHKKVGALAQVALLSRPQESCWNSVRSEDAEQWNIPRLLWFLQAWTCLLEFPIVKSLLTGWHYEAVQRSKVRSVCTQIPATPSPELVTGTVVFKSVSSLWNGDNDAFLAGSLWGWNKIKAS